MRDFGFLVIVGVILFGGCKSPERERYEASIKQGESLAKVHCILCHKETIPALLDKKTWLFKVLPKMGPRLGMHEYKWLTYPVMKPSLVPEQPAMEQ